MSFRSKINQHGAFQCFLEWSPKDGSGGPQCLGELRKDRALVWGGSSDGCTPTGEATLRHCPKPRVFIHSRGVISEGSGMWQLVQPLPCSRHAWTGLTFPCRRPGLGQLGRVSGVGAMQAPQPPAPPSFPRTPINLFSFLILCVKCLSQSFHKAKQERFR